MANKWQINGKEMEKKWKRNGKEINGVRLDLFMESDPIDCVLQPRDGEVPFIR